MTHIKKLFEPVKGPFLLPFFTALLLPWFLINNMDTGLDSLSRDMIGAATVHGINIAKRVNLFYISIAAALLAYAAVNLALKSVPDRYARSLPDADFLNWLSLFGILSILASTTGMAVEPLVNIILTILCLSALLAAGTWGRNFPSERLPFLIIIAAGTSFLIRDICIFSGLSNGDFYFSDFFLLSGFAALALNIVLSAYAGVNILRSGWIAMFSSLAALISVISREMPYILAGRGFHGIDSSDAFIVSVTVGLIISGFHQVSALRKSPGGYRSYLFLSLSGICLFAYYSPVMMRPADMFETANPVLALERLFAYGEIPLLDTFNSHLFFELLSGLFYVALNGYHGMDFLVYDMLHFAIYFIILYFFLRRFTGSDWTVPGILLFFPFVMQMVPLTFAVILLAAMACERWMAGKGVTGLLLVFLSMGAMVLWRIDFGYASILSALVLLLILFAAKGGYVKPKQVVIAAAISLIFPLAFIASGYFMSDGFENNMLQAWHYLRSEQSYGLVKVTSGISSLDGMHYFIFPAFLLFILLSILLKLSENIRQRRFQTLTMIFLSLFYFFNFQRGVIRHGLAEGSSQWLSSFAFFIIPAYLYFLPLNGFVLRYRNMIFVSSSCLLILLCQYPVPGPAEYPLLRLENAFREDSYKSTGEMARMSDNPELPAADLNETRDFFDRHLGAGQTFYDYSNSPMLYYYLHRRPPSYFNQMLLSMHDDFLQDCIADTLSGIDYIVHSNFPESWYDRQDGLAKDVRHSRIAEYINRNFSPYVIAGRHCIWKRKSTNTGALPVKAEFETDSSGPGLKILTGKSETPGRKLLARIWSDELSMLEADGRIYTAAYSAGDMHCFHLARVPEFIKPVSGSGFRIDSAILEYCMWYPDYYSGQMKQIDLFKLPLLLAESFDFSAYAEIALEAGQGDSASFRKIPPAISRDSAACLLVTGCSGNEEDQRCTVRLLEDDLERGRFTFDLGSGTVAKKHLIRVSAMYDWNSSRITHIEVQPGYYASTIATVSLLSPLKTGIAKRHEDQ